MSRRKAKTNRKLEVLNEINKIDKRLKKAWRKDNPEERSKLYSQRETLKSKLKTPKIKEKRPLGNTGKVFAVFLENTN